MTVTTKFLLTSWRLEYSRVISKNKYKLPDKEIQKYVYFPREFDFAYNGIDQAPVVQTLGSAIHWINDYPLDNSIGFASVYPLDSDLSGGQRYPSFEQVGPGA